MSIPFTDGNLDNHQDIADFEYSLQHLKELVERLESGELTLEKSLQTFKEAMRLADHCDAQLRTVEEQIKIISKDMQ